MLCVVCEQNKTEEQMMTPKRRDIPEVCVECCGVVIVLSLDEVRKGGSNIEVMQRVAKQLDARQQKVRGR